MVTMWERDKKVAREKQHRQKEREDAEILDRKTRQAVDLIYKGMVSKAVNRMNSHGLASMSDPRVAAQVKAKHPDREGNYQGQSHEDSQ